MKRFLFLMTLCTVAVSNVAANPTHQKLLKMSENERRQILSSYMQQSGEKCAVVRTFYQGATQSRDVFWNVECKSGGAFAIMIENNAKGSTNILECDLLKQVGGGECFKKFK